MKKIIFLIATVAMLCGALLINSQWEKINKREGLELFHKRANKTSSLEAAYFFNDRLPFMFEGEELIQLQDSARWYAGRVVLFHPEKWVGSANYAGEIEKAKEVIGSTYNDSLFFMLVVDGATRFLAQIERDGSCSEIMAKRSWLKSQYEQLPSDYQRGIWSETAERKKERWEVDSLLSNIN